MAQIRKSQEASHTDGTVAIEYGLILPAMLLFTLGNHGHRPLALDICHADPGDRSRRALRRRQHDSTCPSIPAYAVAQAWGINDVTAANFTATTPTCGVQVAATYTFQFIVPWFPQFGASAPFGAPTMTLNATACYPT